MLEIDELVAFVPPENEPSAQVAEKLGFERSELVEHMGADGLAILAETGVTCGPPYSS
jgi:L-amino acid N-acyltransferase YncA